MKARASRSEKFSIRRQVPNTNDPYLISIHSDETVVCKSCGAVHYKKHWYLKEDWKNNFPNVLVMQTIECPACRKMKTHFPGGIVTLKGDFLNHHREEIQNRIRNEEKRAMENNPLERIIDWKSNRNVLTIFTTTEKLAQRIGRAVHKAFSGEVEYKMSQDEKLMRVYWHR